MVSIENRLSYSDRINESPKLKAFHSLLLGKNITLSSERSTDVDDLFLKLLSSIHMNNKSEFEKIYAVKSKSNPSKDSPSPFVNDDFLIFCLIVGVNKFGIERTWIKNIISIRSRSAATISFENIINGNYFSSDNQAEVILMYLHFINPSLITNDVLNSAYKGISENIALFDSRSDFQILCALKAYDLIIELKEAPKTSEVYLLKKFDQRFVQRTKVLSWVTQASFFCCVLYFLLKLPKYDPTVVELINKYNYIFTILGALGVTFLGNMIPLFKQKSHQSMMRLFGYPKELLN